MLPVIGSHNLVLWEQEGTLSVVCAELVTRLGGIADVCSVKVDNNFSAKLVSESNSHTKRNKLHTSATRNKGGNGKGFGGVCR